MYVQLNIHYTIFDIGKPSVQGPDSPSRVQTSAKAQQPPLA
uniref:Uncharacterized protein n=1 Tax=Anguilla anguilla TaxID=7936 RepID=A0A0E9SEP3_ANGAN